MTCSPLSYPQYKSVPKHAAIELHVMSYIRLSPTLSTRLQQNMQLANVVEPNNVHSSSVVRNYLVWGYIPLWYFRWVPVLHKHSHTSTSTASQLAQSIIDTQGNLCISIGQEPQLNNVLLASFPGRMGLSGNETKCVPVDTANIEQQQVVMILWLYLLP